MTNRNREHDLLTPRLIAAGCRVTTGEESNVKPDITIEARDATDNKVFDLHSRGGIGYIFHVKITNRAYRSLFISAFIFRPLWEDPDFTWLQDIRKYQPESEEYRHPGGRVFRREDVLNHCTGKLGKLNPGEPKEGFLLAWSIHKIPADYLHGTRIPAEIAIIDHFGRPHVTEIEVSVDRSAKIKTVAANRPATGGLFDGKIAASDPPYNWPEFRKAPPVDKELVII